MMFVGPGGCGKRTTALALAQAVNCEQPVGVDACGECASCRRTGRGIDLDARLFKPTRLGYRKEEAQEIRNEAYITPNSAGKKFLILDEVDNMKAEASNLLLKIIEEPPETTVFVLLTENKHLVLPTIKSRTLSVSFRRLNPDEILKVAAGDGITEKEVEYLYPIAGGNAGTIIRLSEDRNLKDLFDDIGAELFERLLGVVPVSPSRLAEEIMVLSDRLDLNDEEDTGSVAQRKSLIGILEIMMVMLERRYMPGGKGVFRESGGGAGPLHLKGVALLEKILESIKSIKGGAHTQLTLENMAIDFRNIASGKVSERAI